MGILASIFGNVVVGWIGRRFLELGGLVWAMFEIFSRLPPETQETVGLFLTGNWQSVTLGALIPGAIALIGYFTSWRSTVKDHVVQGKRRKPLTESEALMMNNQAMGINQTHIPRR